MIELDAEAVYRSLAARLREEVIGRDVRLVGVHTGGVWLAQRLKADLHRGHAEPLLRGKSLAMIFQKPSLRTRVTFEVGSDLLTMSAMRVLDRVAASLRGTPELRVRVSGHTDATGPRDLNMRLSQERAESVMRYLAGQGVAADRMVALGYGPDRPVADNGTAAGRAMNRRVELERMN